MKKGRGCRPPSSAQSYLRRLYGDWFVGLRLTPVSLALVRTAFSVRPSLKPMTRVGVFFFASVRSVVTSVCDQRDPLLRVDFASVFSPFLDPRGTMRLRIRPCAGDCLREGQWPLTLALSLS